MADRSGRERAEELVRSKLGASESASRTSRLTAIGAYLAWRSLGDGHFSRGEEKTIRVALKRDVEAEDVERLLELLRDHPDALRAVDVDYWVDELDAWILAFEDGQYQGNTGHEAEYAAFVASCLAVRWPLLDEPAGVQRWSSAHIDWDDDLLHVGPTNGMQSVEIPWRDLVFLEAVDPWPEALIEWDTRGYGVSRLRIGPRADERPAFGARIEALLEAAAARVRANDAVRPGWTVFPKVEWEPADRLPTGEEPQYQPGYRTAPSRPIPILAHREEHGGMHVLLSWLASGPNNPFGDQVVEAVVTPEEVFVRRRKGLIQRIPLISLRARRGADDAIYVFGRDTELLLTDRASCPVCRLLDQRSRGA